MSEVDLIPPDYRIWMAQRRILRRYLLAFVSLNLFVLGAGAVMAGMTKRAEAKVVELQTANAITEQQQLQLQQLKEQEADYQRQWSILRGLRAGVAVDDIFTIVDRSLIAGELWFLEWSFRRAGVVVAGTERDIDTGYFVIVSADGSSDAHEDVAVETHMTIYGQARDHQALSRFVRALFEQQDIKDVSVKKTSRTDYAGGRVIGFDITIVLNSAIRES